MLTCVYHCIYPGGALFPSGVNLQFPMLSATRSEVKSCYFARLLVFVPLKMEEGRFSSVKGERKESRRACRSVSASILCTDGSPSQEVQKVHFPMSHLVLFCSKLSKSQPPTSCFQCGSRGRFDRCLSETGSLKGKTAKRTALWEPWRSLALLLNGGASWDISSSGTSFRRARASLAARPFL